MSVSKVKHEYKTILDFSLLDDKKISKNLIQQSLRQVEVMDMYCQLISNEKGKISIGASLVYVENEIRVGIYKIKLLLDNSYYSLSNNSKHLKDYGQFQIEIYEITPQLTKIINLSKDSRFRYQPWINKNSISKIRIKDLIDIILYCNRLSKLKLFL